MKLRKFINIEIDGQENIGVLDLGIIETSDTYDEIALAIQVIINQKLPKAIEAHFDEEVEILSLDVVSTLGHILVRGKVRILDSEDDEDCSVEEFSLVETWVY